MKIDMDKYKINKAHVQKWFLDKGDGDTNMAVSIQANGTMVPCIVIAYWLGEVHGYTEELQRHIQVLIKFYGYKSISGQSPDAPTFSLQT